MTPEAGEPADMITCKPRVTDGDRLWFFSGSGEPIEEATLLIRDNETAVRHDRFVADTPRSARHGDGQRLATLLANERSTAVIPLNPAR